MSADDLKTAMVIVAILFLLRYATAIGAEQGNEMARIFWEVLNE